MNIDFDEPLQGFVEKLYHLLDECSTDRDGDGQGQNTQDPRIQLATDCLQPLTFAEKQLTLRPEGAEHDVKAKYYGWQQRLKRKLTEKLVARRHGATCL